jgi:hypothetical protein
METFHVAHLNIQNVNLVIIFLNSQFDSISADQQHAAHRRLQMAATSAGLAGNVVPVWLDPFGNMKFIAPRQQHPFFTSVSYEQLYMSVNRTLTCN